MTLKQFKIIKLIIVMALALTAGWAITAGNYLIPIIAIVLAVLTLLYLRRQVTEIIADERDYKIGGKAALIALQIFSWFAVIAMFFLYAQRDINPSYLTIATVLAYSVCFLLLLYALIFRYYAKFSHLEKGAVYLMIGLIIIFIIALAGMRFFSGEDDWICENGQWIKHGQPDFPAPAIECIK